jgi:hypothetical protein
MAEELDTTQGWCRGYDAVADLADWEHSPTAGPNQKELVVGAGPPVDDWSSGGHRQLHLFAINVERRGIYVASHVISVDPRGNWG